MVSISGGQLQSFAFLHGKDQTFPCQDELGGPKGQDQTRCLDPQIILLFHQDEDAQALGIKGAPLGIPANVSLIILKYFEGLLEHTNMNSFSNP